MKFFHEMYICNFSPIFEPCQVVFPDYAGTQTFEEASDFIVDKFLAVNQVRAMQILVFLFVFRLHK
jgi:hypothetical protein